MRWKKKDTVLPITCHALVPVCIRERQCNFHFDNLIKIQINHDYSDDNSFCTDTHPADIITQGLDIMIGNPVIMISDQETFFPPFSQTKDDMAKICRIGDTNTRINAVTQICKIISKQDIHMCIYIRVCVRDICLFFIVTLYYF